MRSLFVILLITVTIGVHAKPAFDTHALSITWEPLANNYQNTQQSLNAITITNNSKEFFPATGWKIYFNSSRLIAAATVTGNATIAFVNGDLFSLTPAAAFTGIKPGESVRIEILDQEPVITVTDGPEGFYVVWDSEPDKGHNTGAFSIKPFQPEYPGLITPAVIYEQNKMVSDIPEQQLTKVFPTPVSYKETGGVFKLDGKTGINGDAYFNNELQALKIKVDVLLGKKEASKLYPGQQIFLKKLDGLGNEGYELKVMPAGISINASTTAGAFYAIQSLMTLIPPSALAHPQKEIEIPCVEIKDEPRFAYRAFMIDIARNFQPKSEIFRVLDVMALYKLNVLHMHLTDDEGWRLQIAALPELTEVGAVRGHTLDSKHHLPASHGSGGETVNKTGTGFYTRADFIEILKYANKLHIVVEPEIEAPGHARAAVKAMNARYDRLMAEGKKEDAEHYLLYDPNDQIGIQHRPILDG